MAQYICGNRMGNCGFAKTGRPFSWDLPGPARCPGCGSGTVSQVSDSGLPGLASKRLLVWLMGIALIITAVYALNAKHNSPAARPDEAAQNSSQPAKPSDGRSPELPDTAPNPAPKSTGPIANPKLFGLIEIGGKGVKGLVVDLYSADQTNECNSSMEAFAECVKANVKKQFEPHNVNPIEKEKIPETASAAREILDEMAIKEGVDTRHIFLVASSSVSKSAHREELQKAVETLLGKTGEMDFLSPEEEGEYGFQGVLNLIPKNWRKYRKNQAILIDIGSGDTKGGYMNVEPGVPENTFVPLSMPWGTKTFSKEVLKTLPNEVGSQPDSRIFLEAAEGLQKDLLKPAIQKEISRLPGISKHRRIYLIGGISWAVSTLENPGNTLHFPKLPPSYYDSLSNRLVKPDAQKSVCDENPMAQSNKDIAKVCKTFTINDLIAGLEILKAFSKEMKFEQSDKVLFIRDSLYAWPLGYLKTRCREEGNCQPNTVEH